MLLKIDCDHWCVKRLAFLGCVGLKIVFYYIYYREYNGSFFTDMCVFRRKYIKYAIKSKVTFGSLRL